MSVCLPAAPSGAPRTLWAPRTGLAEEPAGLHPPKLEIHPRPCYSGLTAGKGTSAARLACRRGALGPEASWAAVPGSTQPSLPSFPEPWAGASRLRGPRLTCGLLHPLDERPFGGPITDPTAETAVLPPRPRTNPLTSHHQAAPSARRRSVRWRQSTTVSGQGSRWHPALLRTRCFSQLLARHRRKWPTPP